MNYEKGEADGKAEANEEVNEMTIVFTQGVYDIRIQGRTLVLLVERNTAERSKIFLCLATAAPPFKILLTEMSWFGA